MALQWPPPMKEIGRVEIDGQQPPILLDGAREQIQVDTPAGPAVLTYELVGHALDLMHTVVPEPQRGHGVGEALARAALDYARREHLSVRPSCPFVAAFIESHPEYGDLVDPEFEERRAAADE